MLAARALLNSLGTRLVQAQMSHLLKQTTLTVGAGQTAARVCLFSRLLNLERAHDGAQPAGGRHSSAKWRRFFCNSSGRQANWAPAELGFQRAELALVERAIGGAGGWAKVCALLGGANKRECAPNSLAAAAAAATLMRRRASGICRAPPPTPINSARSLADGISSCRAASIANEPAGRAHLLPACLVSAAELARKGAARFC